MVALDIQSISEKRKLLEEAITDLKKLAADNSLGSNRILLGALKYNFILAIESILDIGSHILVENFSAAPDNYEDVIKLLAQNTVITQDLAKKNSGMAKFRNKLIHEYAEIDKSKVLSYLKFAPKQFEEFDKAFKSFISKKKLR